MNILLIWPPNPSYCLLTTDFSCCEPLGLEYIAASLQKDKDNNVEIIDMRFEIDIINKLQATNYEIIGLSIPYTTIVDECNKILKIVHDYNPKIITIVGGHYPSITHDHLSLEYIDYFVYGEGCNAIEKLINSIKYNNPKLNTINGIGIVSNKKVIHSTNRRDEINLDGYPLPARQLVSKYSKNYFHAHYNPVSLIRFSFGCPFNCSFCILWKISNRKYLKRCNESIVEELIGIENENIYVVDDEAFIDVNKMDKLADMIYSKNIKKKYHMYVRSDTIVKNPELIRKWSEIGLDSVLVGLESVFDTELATYNKNISLDMAYQCVKILHSNNVEIRANFIIKPSYTKEQFETVKEIFLKLEIDKPTFAVLTPFIGTDIYEEEKGKFITDKLDFYDCYHTFSKTKLPLKEFYTEFADLFVTANQRDKTEMGSKVFYSGKNGAFDQFIEKIRKSYTYYYDGE